MTRTVIGSGRRMHHPSRLARRHGTSTSDNWRGVPHAAQSAIAASNCGSRAQHCRPGLEIRGRSALLRRLGIDDPAAAAYLGSSQVARQALFGHAGRNVSAEVSDGNTLLKLYARWSPDDSGSFKRLVVEKTVAGFSSSIETASVRTSRLLRLAKAGQRGQDTPSTTGPRWTGKWGAALRARTQGGCGGDRQREFNAVSSCKQM